MANLLYTVDTPLTIYDPEVNDKIWKKVIHYIDRNKEGYTLHLVDMDEDGYAMEVELCFENRENNVGLQELFGLFWKIRGSLVDTIYKVNVSGIRLDEKMLARYFPPTHPVWASENKTQ